MAVPTEEFGILFGGADPYSSAHFEDPGRDIDFHGQALADIHDADDQTKLIAEGARWQAVRTAAGQGLTDQSRFYPNVPAPGGAWQPNQPVPYVTSVDLWKQWNKFQRRWDVNDAEILGQLTGHGAANFQTGVDLLAIASR